MQCNFPVDGTCTSRREFSWTSHTLQTCLAPISGIKLCQFITAISPERRPTLRDNFARTKHTHATLNWVAKSVFTQRRLKTSIHTRQHVCVLFGLWPCATGGREKLVTEALPLSGEMFIATCAHTDVCQIIHNILKITHNIINIQTYTSYIRSQNELP